MKSPKREERKEGTKSKILNKYSRDILSLGKASINWFAL